MIVGITGGLGSGKTIVCSIFSQFGIPVINADVEAKKLYDRDEVKKSIVQLFGSSIINNNSIDKRKIAAIVFNDSFALQSLNELLHPLLAKDLERIYSTYASAPYIIVEAAILIESIKYFHVDYIVSVISPMEVRLKRAMKRDGCSAEELMLRISKQLSDEERMAHSDFIIYNDEDKLLVPQILNLHKILLEKK